MPKRRNPFSDCVPVQMKTHVGMRELANGCMQEELMKEVYERTQDKLFGAMKGNSDLNANHMQSSMELVPSAVGSQTCKVEPQQMKLDGAGHLVCPSLSWNGSVTGHQPRVSDMQWGSIVSQQTVFKFGHEPSSITNSESGHVPNSVTDMQTDGCGHFSSWTHCDSTTFRQHSPVACMPTAGGQLCLDSNGHLTAPQNSAMDCDTDLPQPVSSLGEGGRKSATGGTAGLERWGFMSANTSAPKAHPQSVPVKCQTCRHVPSSIRCQFCERHLCGGCGRQCDSCQLVFCTLCSTLDYNTSSERAFCLSCAG